MSKAYLSYGPFITPLGTTVEENYEALLDERSGLTFQDGSGFGEANWYLGKISDLKPKSHRYSALLKQGVDQLIEQFGIEVLKSDRTKIIVSSTKGEIDDVESDAFKSTRDILKASVGLTHKPMIISNACISGVLAINAAADMIDSEKFDDVFVIGIDVLSDFIVYGFQSLFALSDSPVTPFDKNRKGISIGESCSIVRVSNSKPTDFSVEYLGGSSSNDANHISGPSRTGEGLFRSINKTLNRANVKIDQVDFISAHGTGTNYNDEMESIAFERVSASDIHVNSMKGYYGHTLGASGILETIISMLSIQHETLIKSRGFEEQGTSRPMNVITEHTRKSINYVLKTASGFGGGNASLLIAKTPQA